MTITITSPIRIAAIPALVIALAIPRVFAQAHRGHAPQAPSAGVAVQSPGTAQNLILNGDFEAPAGNGAHPAHWQEIDNLVFFWTADPQAPERGRVIKIDTDVYQSQAYAWWIDRFVHGKPAADAPEKQPTSGLKYDTIAGLDGGYYWSDFIEIKKGAAYKVYIDARGPSAYVFIRGYDKKLPTSFGDEAPATQQQFRRARGEPRTDKRGRPVKYRLRYQYTAKFNVGGSDQWQTYTHEKPRHPTSRELTENVRYLRICIYPYWPPGVYWYDNVRVVEVSPDAQQAKPDADKADIEEGKVVR